MFVLSSESRQKCSVWSKEFRAMERTLTFKDGGCLYKGNTLF